MDTIPYLCGVLVSLGYTCVELMMWTFAFEAVQRRGTDAVRTVGILRFVMMAGVLLGILLAPVLTGSPASDAVRYAVGTTSIAYSLVMSLMLLIDERNPAGFWSAMAPEPAPSREDLAQARCDALAASHGLTERECEVMRYLVAGRSAPFIADELLIATSTVKYHTARLYAKLEVHSKQELIDLFEDLDA